MLGLQWLQVRKILLKWFFQLSAVSQMCIWCPTAVPNSIIVRFLVLEVLEAIQAEAGYKPLLKDLILQTEQQTIPHHMSFFICDF